MLNASSRVLLITKSVNCCACKLDFELNCTFCFIYKVNFWIFKYRICKQLYTIEGKVFGTNLYLYI